MKVTGLLFATLGFVAVAQASYKLSCDKSELGIRWPSYESNSEYFVCPRLFGKQATISCNPGEIFTFALQSCTSPSRYIPPPPVEILPTALPLLSKPNNEGYLTPLEINNEVHPPVLDHLNPIAPEIPVPGYQMPGSMDLPKPPVVIAEEAKHEQLPAIKDEEKSDKKENQLTPPVEIVQKPLPLAPLPPTPAPTPPVVEKEDNHKKPHHAAAGKKPKPDKKKKSSANPSKNNKKPAVAKNPKKTAKSPKTIKTTKAPTKKTPKA